MLHLADVISKIATRAGLGTRTPRKRTPLLMCGKRGSDASAIGLAFVSTVNGFYREIPSANTSHSVQFFPMVLAYRNYCILIQNGVGVSPDRDYIATPGMHRSQGSWCSFQASEVFVLGNYDGFVDNEFLLGGQRSASPAQSTGNKARKGDPCGTSPSKVAKSLFQPLGLAFLASRILATETCG